MRVTRIVLGLSLLFFFDLDLIEIAYAKPVNAKHYTQACKELARCIQGHASVLTDGHDYACQLVNKSGKKGILTSPTYFRYEINQCWKMVNSDDHDADEPQTEEVSNED